MTGRITIKSADLRKSIKGLPKTAELKPLVTLLKKQLSNLDKYERKGDEAAASVELKKMIFASIAKIKKLSDQ